MFVTFDLSLCIKAKYVEHTQINFQELSNVIRLGGFHFYVFYI